MNTIRKASFLILFLVSSLTVSTTALAGPVTWSFSGTVVDNAIAGGTYWNDNGVGLGTVVSGQVTFDPDAAAVTGSFGVDDSGATTFNSAFNSAYASIHSITIGGNAYDPNYSGTLARLRSNYATTTAAFGIPNAVPFDTFAIDNFQTDFQRFQVARIAVTPAGNGLVPFGSFPSLAPDINDLLRGHIYIQELDSDGVTSGLLAHWTTVEQVPEPSMLGLILLGLTGMRIQLRKRVLR